MAIHNVYNTAASNLTSVDCMNYDINTYIYQEQPNGAIESEAQMNQRMNMTPNPGQQFNGNVSAVHRVHYHNATAMGTASTMTSDYKPQQCSDGISIAYSSSAALTSHAQQPLYKMLNDKYMVIFDWDDTLFPTASFIRKYENVDVYRMEEFGKKAHNFLTAVIEQYSEQNVFIVTNGADGWIQKSLRLMIRHQYPLTSGMGYWSAIKLLLSTKFKERIYSARFHKEQHPKDSSMWKTLVFQRIASHHFQDIKDENGECSIISVGDSDDEFVASLRTKKWLISQCGLRSVHLVRLKLQILPTTGVMMQQFSCLKAILGNIGIDGKETSFDMDISAEIEMHERKRSVQMNYQSVFVPLNLSV